MLYIYDNAIAEDLARSIDSDSGANDIVRVMEPDGVIGLIAEMQEDKIKFPLICLFRDEDTSMDTSRYHYSLMHKGIYKGFDPKTNTCYSEKSIPIKLSYTLTILATNTADIDEIVREILFKYTSMYYLKAKVPYEVDDREIRFGIVMDPSSTLSKESSNADYLKEGKLYQSRIKLNCEGAVLISYTGKHMTNFMLDPEINVE